MADQIKNQIESCKKIIRSLNKDLQKRQQLVQQSKGTGMLDMDIKGQISKLEKDLEALNTDLQKANENPQEYGIYERDVIRYRNMYNDILSDKRNVQQNYTTGQNQQHVIKFDTKNQFKDQYDTENMNNQELLTAQKNEAEKQDEKLDQLINVTGQIHTVAKATNKELVEQDEMIDQLDYQMDKNTKKIENTSSKMQKLLKESSNTKLVLGIIVELGLLILFIIWPF